ncbi:transposase [Desulfocurvus sp. DL9XJH121]
MGRKRWTPETKAEIVLQGLKGAPVADLCKRHGICASQYYKWRDILMERLPHIFENGRKARAHDDLKRENERLKKLLGEMALALDQAGDA